MINIFYRLVRNFSLFFTNFIPLKDKRRKSRFYFENFRYKSKYYAFEDNGKFPQYLSVLAIAKNEAPYLKEWIEYHRALGVEKFYIYDNNSSDNTFEILKPYILGSNIGSATQYSQNFSPNGLQKFLNSVETPKMQGDLSNLLALKALANNSCGASQEVKSAAVGDFDKNLRPARPLDSKSLLPFTARKGFLKKSGGGGGEQARRRYSQQLKTQNILKKKYSILANKNLYIIICKI
ncbi:MAG: glycosyltransferase family 2 protein, partial [Elusimicrobiota bacterium]|nr:glycosyltransferase family 2 protein [Elusimicrobiota bacterium]